MKICATMKRFPGEMTVALLLLGRVTNTSIPQVLEIGGFTIGLLRSGTSAPVGLFILCSGTTISLKQAGMPLYKGAVLVALKHIIGVLIDRGLNRAFRPAGILGLIPLAVIMAVTNSNGAVYTALVKELSDSMDVGAIVILSLSDGPFLTMITLGATGLTEIPLISIIAMTVPLSIGIFLGNVGEEFKMLLTNGSAILLPFNGFMPGANMSLMSIVGADAGGIVLGLVAIVCTGVLAYYVYSAIHRKPDPIDMAIGTTGGNAAAVPISVAVADLSLNPVVKVVIAQVAASVVVSAILAPLLTGYFYKKVQKKQAEIGGR